VEDKYLSILKENVLFEGEKVELNEQILVTFLLGLLLILVEYISIVLVLYKVTEIDTELTQEIQKILSSSKWKVRVLEIKDRKGNQIPNAVSIDNNSIFITKGAKELLTKREQVAILLHEAGHTINHDSAKRMLLSYGGLMGSLIVTSMFPIVGPPLDFMQFLTMLSLFYLGILKFSRYQESRADSFAVKMGYGDDLMSALGKLNKALGRKTVICFTKGCELREKIKGIKKVHPGVLDRVRDIIQTKEFVKAIFKGPEEAKKYVMSKYKEE